MPQQELINTIKNTDLWLPDNPYFASAMKTITNDEAYANAIPDPVLRSAVSWYLGHVTWNLAMEAVRGNIETLIAEAEEC